jgi:hypothetical protein
MIVVVPYVELHPATVPAIEAQGYDPVLAKMEGASYPRLLLDLFARGEDFCIDEQDVESHPGALDELRDCPEPWCWNAYPLGPADGENLIPYATLGHTRFRAGLSWAVDALRDDSRWLETWVARDAYLGWHLLGQGLKPHRHRPDVTHHHRYDEAHASEEWGRVQDARIRAGDPSLPLFIFRCGGCGLILRTERSSVCRTDQELAVEKWMCPVCAEDPALWSDWAMPV